MSRKTKQHTKQFKLDAINYRKEHPDLTQVNVPKISVLVSVPLVNGKHSLEIMMAIFLSEDPATTNRMKWSYVKI